MMGGIKKNPHIQGKGMVGGVRFSNISFHNLGDGVKGIIEDTAIKSRGGVDRQNLSGQKYLVPAWDRAKTISMHTQKTKPTV